MTPFHARPCSGPDDISLMRELLITIRSRIGLGCWHIGDLTWRTFLMTIRNPLFDSTRLWFNNDRLVGYAIAEPPRREDMALDIQVHPDAAESGIIDEMLGWAEEQWQAVRSAKPRSHLVVDPGVYENDTAFLNALARHGFDNVHNDGILLLRSLDAPVGTPTLPEGWMVRAITGESEAPKRAAVHRDAFHPSRVTDEQYLRLMGWPGYRDALDLVAVSPEGEFGSFCLGWLDPVNRIGEFEPVGTHSAFRRRGLASAVIIDGLRRMRDAGMTSAFIGPIEESDTRALAVYQSLGFEPNLKMYMYGKS